MEFDALSINDAGVLAGTVQLETEEPDVTEYPFYDQAGYWNSASSSTFTCMCSGFESGGKLTYRFGGGAIDAAGEIVGSGLDDAGSPEEIGWLFEGSGGVPTGSGEPQSVASLGGTPIIGLADINADYELGLSRETIYGGESGEELEEVTGPFVLYDRSTHEATTTDVYETAAGYGFHGLSNDGALVGSSSQEGSKPVLRLANGTEVPLAVPAGDYARAGAINDSHLAVGSVTVPGVGDYAAMWEPNGQLTNLNSLVPEGSGWQLEAAVAINNSGTIVGDGTHNGVREGFILAPARRAAVSPNCAQTATANIFDCTITVSDASGASQLIVPTGGVSLGVSIGSFEPLSGQCTLTAALTPGSASCTLVYKGPTAGQSPAGAVITAVYEGDGEFSRQTTTTTLCSPALSSATAAKPGPFGAHPQEAVTLTGSGFCTGEIATFGNEKAQVPLSFSAIGQAGRTATLTIPRLATTGQLSLALGSDTTKLGSTFAIDSWRNTEGFPFHNFTHHTNYGELVEAFGEAQTLTPLTVNTCAPDYCPTTVMAPIPTLKYLDETTFEEAMERGVCFGMALASLQLQTGRASLAAFDPTAQDVFQLGTTAGPGPSLEKFIVTRMLLQYSDQYKAYVNAEYHDKGRTTGTFVDEVEPAVENGEQLLVGMASKEGSHEVLATGIQSNPEEPGSYLIETVDSNNPFIPGQYSEESTGGEVHAANATYIKIKEGKWEYPSTNWSDASPQELTAVPLSVLSGPLTLKRWRHYFDVDASIAPGLGIVALQNGGGEQLQVGEAGITPDPSAVGGDDAPEASFTAPLAAYTDTLKSSGNTPISESWAGDEGLLAAEGHAKTASIGFEPKSFEIEYAPHGKSSGGESVLTLISEPAKGTTRSAEVRASNASASLTAALGAHRDELSITSSATTKLAITLEQDGGRGALGPQRVPSFTLPAGATAHLKPSSWRGKAIASVAITLKPKHGHARKLRLKTRGRSALSPLKVTHLTEHPAGKRVKLTMRLHTPKLPTGSTEALTAIVAIGHHHPRSYPLLRSRRAIAGTRKLTLTVATHHEPATVKIVALSISSETGALATRTTRLRIPRQA